jgi:CheY-like chemotaxis protein
VANILVVDDDLSFRRLAAAALRSRGHDVLEAARVSAAEEILSKERPDLLIVDRLLPDADGAAWIAKRGEALRVPFILASAFRKGGRDGGGPLNSQATASGFLRKPVADHAIASEVERVLAMTSPRPAAPDEDAGFAALRAQYSAELGARLARIRKALERLRRTPRDTECFLEVRRLVHDLAGTAGSFGYAELSAIGGRLQEALTTWQWTGAGHAGWSAVVANGRALAELEDSNLGAPTSTCAIGTRVGNGALASTQVSVSASAEHHQVAPRSSSARAMAASTGGEKK